jgi:hypothetical protein
MSFKSVDFPDPFSPMTPNVQPLGTVKETSWSAVKVWSGERSERRLPVRARSSGS